MLRRVFAPLASAAVACALGVTPSFADSLTLDSCLALARAHHPDLRAASLDVAAADARVRQAGALEPPSLGVEVGKVGSSLGNADRDESWRLTQDLPLFGQRARSVRAALAERDLVRAGRAAAELRLRGEVTRAYRRLQADSLALRELQALGGTARQLEQMVSVRLRSGGARYLDVLRARSERVRIDNEAIDAARALRAARRSLNAWLARDPDSPLAAADTLVRPPLLDSPEDELQRARRTRPGLAAARIAVSREQARAELVRRTRWPAASASAGLDRVPGAKGPGFGGELTITLPFAPWSAARERAAEVAAERSAAEARLERAERSLTVAVLDAHESARAAEARLEGFEQLLLADARDALRTAIQNYQAGQIEGLELLETLRTLRGVELEHVRALLDYHLALADLEVAE